MAHYVLRRLAVTGGVLLACSVLVFALLLAVRGDPAETVLRQRLGGEAPSPEAVARLRADLGLDAPAPLRYLRWLAGAATGDFGLSFHTGEPVVAEVGPRLLRTLLLASISGALVVLLSLAAALAAARSPDGVVDHVLGGVMALLAALPVFVLGIGLVLLFAVGMRLLPAAGDLTPAHYVLPALTLGLVGAGAPARVLRGALLAEAARPHAVAARARGASAERVLTRHALPNALVPWAGAAGLSLRGLLGGAVLVETVFDFRGLGSFLVESVHGRDIPAVQAVVLLLVLLTAVVNLATDAAVAALDPRVRFGGGAA